MSQGNVVLIDFVMLDVPVREEIVGNNIQTQGDKRC